MYLYPGDQPMQLPSSTWVLATVLTCGLKLPLTAQTNVQVVRSPASRGLEDPLTSAQLTGSGQWQEAGALPVISVDGSEDQTTYTRPWQGGSDDNAADQVTVQGQPIAIAVYESGPPLTVSATTMTLSESATAMKVKFTATVHNQSGATVPASSLTWSWTFGDGGSSNAATPTHAFAAGRYPVTVQVTDAAAGTGGTDTIEVAAHTSNKGSGTHRHGGGNKHTNSRAPVGPNNSHGTHPGAGTGHGKGSGSKTSGANGSSANSTTSGGATGQNTGGRQTSDHRTSSHSTHRTSPHRAVTRSTTTPTTPTTPTTHPSTPTRPGHRAPRRQSVPRATIAPSAPLVRGRLISDVTPLSPASSTLVRTVPAARSAAPQVRQATAISVLPAVLGGLAVVLLLTLGAARELRGRGGWHALRTDG
jgi:hypothetical protein